jgi:hypothetical protein
MLQDDEIIPHKVLNGKFHNTRPIGKPRKDERMSSGGTDNES